MTYATAELIRSVLPVVYLVITAVAIIAATEKD